MTAETAFVLTLHYAIAKRSNSSEYY